MSDLQQNADKTKEDTYKPNFVIKEQSDVPAFLAGKKREEYLRLKEIERIQNIDRSKDEDFKVTMFGFWKKERERNGKPLTTEEEKYYTALQNKHNTQNIFVVFLPMAILVVLQKSVGLWSALVVSLTVGVVLKMLFIFYGKWRSR